MPDPLVDAVENYLQFIRTSHPELTYEARQALRKELIFEMERALDQRKACAA